MFVRIEYWSPIAADWWVGHKGVEMADPEAYIKGLNARNRAPKPPPVKMIARAVVIDTGEIIYGDGGDLL